MNARMPQRQRERESAEPCFALLSIQKLFLLIVNSKNFVSSSALTERVSRVKKTYSIRFFFALNYQISLIEANFLCRPLNFLNLFTPAHIKDKQPN